MHGSISLLSIVERLHASLDVPTMRDASASWDCEIKPTLPSPFCLSLRGSYHNNRNQIQIHGLGFSRGRLGRKAFCVKWVVSKHIGKLGFIVNPGNQTLLANPMLVTSDSISPSVGTIDPVLVALPTVLVKLPKIKNLRNNLFFYYSFILGGWGKFVSLIEESVGFTANRRWERGQAATFWFACICPSLLLISKFTNGSQDVALISDSCQITREQ